MANQKMISIRDYQILAILNTLVVIYMVFGTITFQKLINIHGYSISIASVWFSLLTFPVTDVICNEFEKKYARFAVLLGWLAMILTSIMAKISAFIPPSESFLIHEKSFDFLMNNSIRFVIIVTFSYLISQLVDIQIFHLIKKITHDKYLWLRNNISTIISQTVNSFIFVFGLFFGIVSFSNIFHIFLSTVLLKIIIAFLDTPLVYLGVYLVRKYRDP